MKTLVVILVLIAGFLAAPTAEAQMVGQYSATITADNTYGGSLTDWGAAFTDWSCHASTTTRFSETLRDHKGRAKDVPRNVKSDWGYSLFRNPQVRINFEHDVSKQSQLSVDLTESCSRTVPKTCQRKEEVRDTDGRVISTREVDYDCSETQTAHMTWTCKMSGIPKVQGATQRLTCDPSSSYFGDYGIGAIILSNFKQKTFIADVRVDRVSERFQKDLCGGAKKNRVIVQLSQGTGGHTGENDFVFHVNIDGHKFEFAEPTGLLNHDIAYCGGGSKINVGVTATEKDLVSSDSYSGAGGNASVSLSRRAPGNSGRISLQRKTYFGEIFTDKSHEILVRIIDLNTDPALTRAVSAVSQAGKAVQAGNNARSPAVAQKTGKNPAAKAPAPSKSKGVRASSASW